MRCTLGKPLQAGLPAENLDLPPSEQFFSKNVQFCQIFGKISYFYPFLGHFWPKLRHFYPIFKNTEFWKKSLYRLIFGIPATLAALPTSRGLTLLCSCAGWGGGAAPRPGGAGAARPGGDSRAQRAPDPVYLCSVDSPGAPCMAILLHLSTS